MKFWLAMCSVREVSKIKLKISQVTGATIAQKQNRKVLFAISLKFFLLLLAIGISYEFLAIRIRALESLTDIVIYGALLGGYVGILLTTILLRSFGLRIFWAAVLVPAFFIYESAQRIFGEPMSYSAFVTLVSARGFVADSIGLYGSQMILPLVQSLLLFGSIVLPFGRRDFPQLPAAASYPVLGTVAMIVLLYARGGYGAGGLPSMFTTLSYGSLYTYSELTKKVEGRQSISMSSVSTTPTPNDIILIMDESIRGDYLDINSTSGVYSGLARQVENVHINNFGIAASASHCSDATNLIVRYGSTRKSPQKHVLTMPSLWQYAKEADYRSIYVDAQRIGGELHNRMTLEERQSIDQLIQFENVPVLHRDMATISALDELLSNSERDFIYVNKIGAHFPVHDKYPDDFLIYEPALPRGAFGSISDTGDRVGLFSGDWDAYKNSYRNTIAWTVGEYFDRFFETLDLENAVVIYTSDHGQNFHERGEPGYNTHCSMNPSMEEGVVPLVVMVGEKINKHDFTESADRLFNQASQFGLFSTLLQFMGFDSDDMRSIYEPSWFDQKTLPFSFFYTFNAKFGAEQKFKSIELNELDSSVLR